ncbi:MAG: hypothetical protein M9930_05660 [Anaerolineae bacterium]|nr:hypothetical protein [Anaerolineae bacterium]
MHIITPTALDPSEIVWEGALAPVGEVSLFKSAGPDADVRVAIGRPVSWEAAAAVKGEIGKTWTPPANDRSYTLLRLAFTLYPPTAARTSYRSAMLIAYLRPRSGPSQVVVHDLYPQRVTQIDKGKVTVGLTPELKFSEAFSLKAGELGAEIEFQRAIPVVQSYGLGQSQPQWQYQTHAAYPLLGDQFVYLVADAAANAGGLRLTVELVATVETRFGPIRLGTPQEARALISHTIP